MPRRRHHEEHTNHEAWAIPYGDLLTLLLAFFVVMYAISSVNEGKYRVLSDALNVAFGGTPKAIAPIQVGNVEHGTGHNAQAALVQSRMIQQAFGGTQRDLQNPSPAAPALATPIDPGPSAEAQDQLRKMGDQIEHAMGDLIARKLVTIKRGRNSIEVQLRTDILFSSGSADISVSAVPVLDRLAAVLKNSPNKLRVEGHTDNVPIHTSTFPSNWELSAARAASVVHLFTDDGVAGTRLSVAGFGEFQPLAGNDSAEGRNQNRRVSLIVQIADNAALPAGVEAASGVAAAVPVAPAPVTTPARPPTTEANPTPPGSAASNSVVTVPADTTAGAVRPVISAPITPPIPRIVTGAAPTTTQPGGRP